MTALAALLLLAPVDAPKPETGKPASARDALRPFNVSITEQFLPPARVLELAGVIASDA